MIKGYEVYKIFHAINLHFNIKSYNFKKYNGKTNVTPQAWYKRKDKFFFEKLGVNYNRDQILEIFVSYHAMNFEASRNLFGKEIINHANSDYRLWKKKMDSLEYHFEKEFKFIIEEAKKQKIKIKHFITPVSNNLPEIVSLLISKKICPETFLILDSIFNVIEKIDKCEEEFLWPGYREKLLKYSDFITIDEYKYKRIIQNIIRKN